MTEHATRRRFMNTCQCVGIDEQRMSAMWDGLVLRYTEDHRWYHNMHHLDKMLGWLDVAGVSDVSMELGIWFHDIVYQPLSKDNEVMSIRYFEENMGPYVSEDVMNHVERYILATDPGRARSGCEDENLIIDIDLSILGSSPEEYRAYCIAIRKEYAVVPDDEFTTGRRAVMEHFLLRPIYTTELFADREEPARRNIENELERLKGMK